MVKHLFHVAGRIMLLALMFSVEKGSAQSTPSDVSAILPTVTPPSPNAASLGIYGQVPVSPFNGLPQISIPLGNVVLDEVNVDISLGYHGGGINPEQHPGWVGLGWNLNAGGAITRRVNGRMDEVLSTNIPETIFNYYNNFSKLDISDWYTPTNLNRYASFNPAEFGDPAPDEFMFNFGNYSGSFYLDHKGKWQVKSESPVYIKVEQELATDFKLKAHPDAISSDIYIKQIFYKFTLTTPDGVKYVFGGDPDAIEFTRGANSAGDGLYHNNVVPTSWYLTKIITKTGRQINFKYKREDIIATQSSSLIIYSYNERGANVKSASNPSARNISIINPCYLMEINAPSQRVLFNMDNSKELLYNYEQATLDLVKGYLDFKNVRGDVTNLIKWKQLDDIEFYSTGNNLLKAVSLRYSSDLNSRLMLNGVYKQDAGYKDMGSYQFDYDPTPLPPYNAQKMDHWGFYNGVNFFDSKPNTYTYTKADVPDYIASRAPDSTYMKAGILTGIRYPTGGYTKFEYEPHRYSLIAKRYPFAVESANGNVLCGGLRIKKITDTAFPGSAPNTKEYFYVKDYHLGGTTSSGILAGKSVYEDEGDAVYDGKTITYWYWYDYAIQPLSYTNGNHVTYSEVVEKSSDGGFVINNYANHDQAQYLDRPMLGGVYALNNIWNLDPCTSMALDRGKVLRKRYFKADKTLVKDTRYEYDESTGRYDNNIRIINLSLRNFGFAREFRATAYQIFTFPRYLTRETNVTYDQNGVNQVTTTQSYTYDNLYRLLKTSSLIDSKGHNRINTYNYPPDYAPLQADNPAVYTEMLNRNMISAPIETSSAINYNGSNKVTAAKLQLFAKDAATGNILPAKVLSLNVSSPITDYVPASISTYTEVINGVTKKSEKLLADNRLDTILYFDKYDTSGNLLQMHKSGDQNISFLWGYNGLYPVAKVTGSDYTTISGLVNSDSLQNPSGDQALRDKLNNIRKNVPATTMVFTYTYAPVTGVTSETSPAGNTTYYEYDTYQRLKRIKDQDGKILKQYDYQYQATLTPNWKATGRKNCVIGTGGYLTGEQQVEERDINPYSYSRDSVRWTKAASADCPVVADWRATGVKQCAKDGFDHYTGDELAEQKDINPYSATYNTSKWINNGKTAACSITSNWQPTGNSSCILDAWGSNTGDQSVQEKDMNPLSPTYNTTHWVTKAGIGNCPVTQSCSGLGYRVVKNVCEHGQVTVSGTIIQDVPRKWKCTFTIKYSYGPAETVETYSTTGCTVIQD